MYSGELGVAPAQASLPLDSIPLKSSLVEEERLHGCFSPRGSPCTSPQPAFESDGMDGMLAPLLQIIPELTELCGEPSVVVVVVSTTPSSPPSEPCQTLAHVDSGGLDASATLLSVDIGHVVSLSDQIAETGVLAPNYEGLCKRVAKELSDLLVNLEAASLGYVMEIASVLAERTSKDMIKMVEKSLMSKGKKRGRLLEGSAIA
jgi:hypothetical protein